MHANTIALVRIDFNLKYLYETIIIKYNEDNPNVIVLINDKIEFNTPSHEVSKNFLTLSTGKLISNNESEPINNTGNNTIKLCLIASRKLFLSIFFFIPNMKLIILDIIFLLILSQVFIQYYNIF